MDKKLYISLLWLVSAFGGFFTPVLLSRRSAERITTTVFQPATHTNEVGGKDSETRISDLSEKPRSFQFGDELSRLLQNRDFVRLEQILIEWSRRDPLGALSWAEHLQGVAKNTALNVVLAEWIKANPNAAFSWAKEKHSEFFSSGEFIASCVETKSYSLGIDGLKQLKTPSLRGLVTTQFFESMAKLDLAGAWNQLVLLDSKQQRYAIQGILRESARQSPAEGQAWIQRNAVDASTALLYGKEYFNSLIDAHGIDSVLDMLNSMSSSPASDSAKLSIANKIAVIDPESSAKYVSSISDPAVRNAAISAVAIQLAETRPEIAAPLIVQTTNQPKQLTVSRLEKPLYNWSLTSPDAARAFLSRQDWLSSSDLDRLNAVMAPAIKVK